MQMCVRPEMGLSTSKESKTLRIDFCPGWLVSREEMYWEMSSSFLAAARTTGVPLVILRAT